MDIGLKFLERARISKKMSYKSYLKTLRKNYVRRKK